MLTAFGEIKLILQPKQYFPQQKELVHKIVELASNGFGFQMGYDDVLGHLTAPQKVLLGYVSSAPVIMYAHSHLNLKGRQVMYVDGVVVRKDFQTKGMFPAMTRMIAENAEYIGLRTQNPAMQRALEKYCKTTHPGHNDSDEEIKQVQQNLAKHLGMNIDENGLQKGFYPIRLSYNKILQNHVFTKIGVMQENCDAVLVVGKCT
ncbi:hypothetical protein HY486_00030 [Candidatus Woesearchaeota archaeon]|nr:hypothetical protein [Candidatus Woesearchaeota archaeon]